MTTDSLPECPGCVALREQNRRLADLLVQEADALHAVREYALEMTERAGAQIDAATVGARLWPMLAGIPTPVRPCPVCVERAAQCRMVADSLMGLVDLKRAPL